MTNGTIGTDNCSSEESGIHLCIQLNKMCFTVCIKMTNHLCSSRPKGIRTTLFVVLIEVSLDKF